MQCPTKDELNACLLGKVADAQATVLLKHADECDSCGRLLDELDNASSDHVTNTLMRQSHILQVSDECKRMIDRAEIYVQGDVPDSAEESTTTKTHLLQGTKIRDYEIIRPIGEGGMGAVFLARHNRLKRDVALKVLSLRRSGDREAQRRFEQEMTIVGKLEHPGIVRALDAGEADGVQYLVMELIEGADLREIVDALGPIPLADACELCRRAANALDYAHKQHLIHRDVKPSNIMLQNDGTVKLMDLGLARFTDQHLSLTSTQQAMGSLDFMAPEQLRASDVDRRADIYGLACTLHFLLMGEPPEKRRTASLMVPRTPKLETLRGVLPPPLTKLMQHMLAADPAKRCDSLIDVVDQLAPFCNRADLKQLSGKTQGLVGEVFETAESITSEVDKVVAKPKSRRATFAAVIGAATIAAAWALTTMAPFSFGSEVYDLDKLPCISSNIEPVPEIPLFQIHEGAVRHAIFNEGTSQLICGSDDTSISVRDLPNQARIIRVCLCDSPIEKLQLVQDSNQFVCLDRSGNIGLLQLPAANVVWTVPPGKFESRALNICVADDKVLVQTESHGIVALSLENGEYLKSVGGEEVEFTAAEFTAAEPVNIPLPKRLLVGDEKSEVRLARRVRPNVVCIADRHLARLVNLDGIEQPDYRHFVYAEHTKPITCVFAFPDDSLVFTGDASGEVHLWQAPGRPRSDRREIGNWHVPGRPRSDMLLSCAANIDSAQLTMQIHRQNLWSRRDFSTSPEEVKFDDLLGEMRIETEIGRNGVRHVLEYRVNPNAAK